MCVIAYIPKESKGMSYKDFKDMWITNPDGAGIMWIENDNRVYFRKGYFDPDELYRDYLVIKEDHNFECALHFRIATAGGINDKMCHPFVMTNNDDIIVKTEGRADVLVMHNGIIKINNRPNFSDTAEYIERNLYPMYRKDNRFFLHFTKRQKALLENEIGFGSKLLIFSGDGIEKVGKWFNFKDFYCSNLYFNDSYWKKLYNYNNYNYDIK